MEKIWKVLFLFLVWGITIPVFAENFKTQELISIDQGATIETDLFVYDDIRYINRIEGKEYGRFHFNSITNKTDKSLPVSINILLFDGSQKNIGYVTYCTEQDVESEFNHMKLQAGASTPFYINVTSRYYVEGYSTTDVLYFAVYDDNQYCHVGGYDKYKGLTMHEISSGRVVAEDGMERASVQWEDFIINTSFLVIGGLILGVIGVFVVQGLILNALHKRMYASTTALAYLPITNTYITVKMAFGPRIAMVFIIAYLISVPLSFLGIFILSVFLSFVPGFAFILDIIKLFSQKYDLCYLEPFEYNSNVATGGKFTLNQDSTPVVNTPPQETIPAPTDHVEADPSGDKVLDLNYSTNEPVQPVGDLEESNEDGFSYEDVSGKSPEPSDENEENSDLMNLFK